MSEGNRIVAADLYRARLVSDPQIAPDGRLIVFCLQSVEPKTEQKVINLWLVPADGSRPARQFTHGQQKDTHPRWSPDGRTIAFLSDRADEKQAQIYLLPVAGGEARPLTSMTGSMAQFAWSPDGGWLLCQFRQKDQEAIEREQDEQRKKLGVVARHVTRLDYREDGVGYAPRERWHLWRVDAATGEAIQLTSGEYDETEPCWSPAGDAILFISNRSARPDMDPDATELYAIPAAGGEMRQIPTRPGRKSSPAYSPDGRWIAYLGRRQKGKYYQNATLFLAPTAGGEVLDAAGELDLHLASVTNGDMGGSPPLASPTWQPDSQGVICMATWQGDQPLLAISLAGAVETVAAGGVIGPFSASADGRQLAYVKATLDDPGQVWIQDVASGEARPLTDFNRDWLAELELGHTEELWFDGPDGTSLHGWITFPPGFDPQQQHPSILEIHGGPQTQYGRTFMHEFHFLAAQGYVVYWCNPRGSQGYGEAWAGSIYGCWGTVDYADVMAWADYMAAQPYIDPERMGVTGGSYGGYMTALIIGKTRRFRAAVAQRVVSNVISFYGSSDLNWVTEYLMGAERPPWEALETYWDMSPMKYIGHATTPTLLIHSEQDLRCQREQGEQVFVALRRQGVDTELVLFPEESHGLSRIGRTDRRVARLEHMARWFNKYLQPG